MKKVFYIVALFIFGYGTEVLASGVQPGQGVATPAGMGAVKWGMVDNVTLMRDNSYIKNIEKNFKQKFEGRGKDLAAEEKQFQDKVNNLEKNKAVMKEDEQKKKREEFMNEYKSLQDKQMKFQNEIAAERDSALAKVNKVVEEAISKIAKEKGLDFVLSKQAVLYSNSQFDITPEVTKAIK